MRQARATILGQVKTPRTYRSSFSHRNVASDHSQLPFGPKDELKEPSLSPDSLPSSRDSPPHHLPSTSHDSLQPRSSSSLPTQPPGEVAPSSSSSPNLLAARNKFSSSYLLPPGWTSVQGTAISPEIARIFATVNQRLSASYEEEMEEQINQRRDQREDDDNRLPGRLTDDALVHQHSTAGGDESPGPVYGGLPIISVTETYKKQEAVSTQESRRESDDGSRAYSEFLSRSGPIDLEDPWTTTPDNSAEVELVQAMKELEREERTSRAKEKTLSTWEPFASDLGSSSSTVVDLTKENLPTWTNSPRTTTSFPTISSPNLRSLVDPRSTHKQVALAPDSFTSLPPLPWSTASSSTEPFVPPRPSSFLNAYKPHDDAPWEEDATEAEHRRLDINLDDLAYLHPSLINQQTLLHLLDEFLPLANFKGDRRKETLDKLFACGLVPSRALMQTMLRAVARWRDDLVGTRTETEAIIEQMAHAGLEESKEEKIETLALVERVYLQNGNIVAAKEVKAQLYSLTPTPPRPTELLLRQIKPTPGTKVTLSQILPLISELNASNQTIPDDALEILARIVPLDVCSFQGFVDAAGFVEGETRRTLTPGAWAIFMDRAFSPRPEPGPQGWLPRSKKVAQVDLDVVLRLFHRIQNPSPHSIAAGIKLISRVAIHPSPLDQRVSTIQEVYKSVLEQLVGSSSTPTTSGLALPSSSIAIASSASRSSLSLPSDKQQLETLLNTTIGSLLDPDVPFTLTVASILAQVHADQQRLLGYSDFHHRTLIPLRDPPYPMKPSHIDSVYSILLAAFPEEMKPVELYWSFLTRAGRTIRAEPLSTTKAVLSIVQARMRTGEVAYAGKTMLELVETLKAELWRGEALRRRAGGTTKGESLDRDPRRALLAIETVALEMNPRSLSAEFWNSLVEATSFSIKAQWAAWKVLVEVYPEEIGENAIILRLRTAGESKSLKGIFETWKVFQQHSRLSSPLIWNAWFEALLRIGDYELFVSEIVRKSPEPANDDLLRWALDRLHESSSPPPTPPALASLSLDSEPIPRAAQILPPPPSDPVLEEARLLKLKATLREEFGSRMDRVEERRKLERLSKDNQVLEPTPTPFSDVSPPSLTSTTTPQPLKPPQNLLNGERQTIILDALKARGVSPTHPAHTSLFDALLELSHFSLKKGSYLDIRAMFHPSSSSSPTIPPISPSSFTDFIKVHLEILNVNTETSYIPPTALPRLKIEDRGGFGMRSSAAPLAWRKKFPSEEDHRDRKSVLDFTYKEVKW